MLKFFRKYNKWILVVGASVLMVAFLMPMQGLGTPNQANQTMGRAGKTNFTYGQRAVADHHMRIIAVMSGGQLPIPVRENGQNEPDPLAWLLIQHEARQLGLYASDLDVLAMRELMAQVSGIDSGDQFVAILADRASTTVDHINEAMRGWLIYQRYQELMLGLGHKDLTDRLVHYLQVGRMWQMGMIDYALMMYQSAQGRARVSTPLMEHMVSEQRAQVEIEMLRVDARRYLDEIEQPDEAQLLALYEKHKDDLPDQSEPYGLGYRFPDRVKLEFFVLPFDRLLRQVDVEEADMYDFYDRNKSRFVEEGRPQDVGGDLQITPAGRQQEYPEVRQEIRTYLSERAAERLAAEIFKAATLILSEDARQLRADETGYRVTEGFVPISLSQVADRLQQQFDVRPDVIREDSRWLVADDLANLPGIGQSRLAGDADQGASFVRYVLSAREITGDDTANPLTMLRLQARLPSQPLTDPATGDRYLFRIIEAEGSRQPHDFEEVREQVTSDARRLAAYEKLLAHREFWVDQLAAKTLTSLQLELNESFLTPPPFPKRVGTAIGAQVPYVEGVGVDEAFVDRVFAIAQRVLEAGGIGNAPPVLATDAIPVDREQAIMLVRLLNYHPITRDNYNLLAADPSTQSIVLQSVVAQTDEWQDPLSLKALIRRTGYVGEGDGSRADQPADAENENAPTQARR